MATIQVDEDTAAAITAKAASQGITVAELLRRWIAFSQAPQELTADEFDRTLDELSGHAPPLPADFSRADIYYDHD